MMATGGQMETDDAMDQMDQDDYYSNFARRVYFLADQESWPKEKTMRYFNDKPAFEKYYNNVSRHSFKSLSDTIFTSLQWKKK